MFTWYQFQTHPVQIEPNRTSVYTGPFWNWFGKDPKLDQLSAGPILDPFGSIQDRLQNGPTETEADPVQFSLERFWSRPIPIRSGPDPERSRVTVAQVYIIYCTIFK